jgi:endonuclease/exonuclease/phosphatase family metal-dependent hydrolase
MPLIEAIPADDVFTLTNLNLLHSPFRFKARMKRIGKETAAIAPDIFCAQEVFFEKGHNSKALDFITEQTGLSAVSVQPHFERHGAMSGTAILSAWPVIEAGDGRTPEDGEVGYNSCYAVLESPSGRPVIVFSIHGAWGGHRENVREQKFLAINAHATELEEKYSDRDPITVIAGDFNTRPDSSSMRFMRGLQSLHGQGTYWTDAWEALGEGPGFTSVPTNKLAIKTALEGGIFLPQILPGRRIDYIMVKGWKYGRIGSPINISIDYQDTDDEGFTVSDHFGLTTRIWNPINT